MDSEVESTEPRTAYEVISDAIRENRFSEYLLYFFSGAFVVCGLGVLIVSMFKGQDVTAIVGGVASALFYPAIREARKIRDKNETVARIPGFASCRPRLVQNPGRQGLALGVLLPQQVQR